MGQIHLLNQDTINKIAAGEVVERPISVIKELIENAIDAKATSITVAIEDGGLKLMRITDNGIGMKKDDVENAFLRHATSKIEDAKDLESIHSLGFRGEALASIAAVSMVECMTKTKDDITGIRYQIEGGIEKSFQDIGCPSGTTFVVRELFFNVPARKKFLKKAKTEGAYVTDLVHRIALSHPGISFKYMINNKVKLHTSGNFSLIDCIYQVFGRDFAKNSKEVNYVNGDIKITGFIGEPTLSRGNRQYEIYYVNDRYIKSAWIQKGIEEGTKEAMMIHQFPFAVLFLDLPNDQVDVNVHPNKMQVRFDNEAGISEYFRLSIIEALKKRVPVVSVRLSEDEDYKLEKRIRKEEIKQLKDAPEPFEINRLKDALVKTPKVSNPVITKVQIGKPNLEIDEILNNKKVIDKEGIKLTQQTLVAQNLDVFLDEQQIKKHKIIGQVFKTYWIVEYHNELYIIDQHAAHEKVLYEAWLNSIKIMDIPSQVLLEPLVYDLSDSEYAIFETFNIEIKQLGFDVEAFGGTTIIVKSVPYLLNMPMNDLDFIHFFDQLVAGEVSIKKEEQYLQKIASVACKAAIKGNNKLSEVEYRSLIDQLLTLDDPYHCPHGRPSMIRMSKYELEKKFRRII